MKGLEMDQALMPPWQDKLRAFLLSYIPMQVRKGGTNAHLFAKKKEEKEKRRGEKEASYRLYEFGDVFFTH
jgi:hypothetical protein